MSSQLVCRPEQDLPVAVLRVSGVLDTVTGDALDRAVTRSLATQPESLLVDVSELEVADPVALDVLSSIVCRTAEWPAVPLVLCGAEPATARTLRDRLGCDGVTTEDSCAKALAAHGWEEPEPHRIRLRLRPVPDACRQVRHVVTQACTAWQVRDLAATVGLVATELVANVVRHAHTTMEFTLGLRDGLLCLTVRDGSRKLPRPRDPGVSEAGGRGLHLVRELTDAWGVLPVPGGKVVWTKLTTGAA
ncbi:anti-anti-sigma factor [Actinoplanes sp. NBRC 14428]|uniref:Anti-sigma regulatory factor (Ser/Thr protein kinase) n=1 Tax=Pseudosporangium ferrugineum TaxID=439699 RepID=A0A2T0SJR5_9ACTN|nr:ATP-binding protein [Pseudosporangium ferrugineum]PRY33657.1 anti-sigma regulatory factor (Ser/Thr protein kinase) [Pseudosporangium ferrugineum]BCJ56389.1 anti-anti-sigma factor [Actinoplanes sp. NBRC 14428]